MTQRHSLRHATGIGALIIVSNTIIAHAKRTVPLAALFALACADHQEPTPSAESSDPNGGGGAAASSGGESSAGGAGGARVVRRGDCLTARGASPKHRVGEMRLGVMEKQEERPLPGA